MTATRAKVGRKPREPLPKGEEAEKELERQRRNERRRLRKAKKAALEAGEDPEAVTLGDEQSGSDWPVAPTEGGPVGPVPDAEQLKAQFWGAFNELGGMAGLVQWGRRYPKEFYAVWSRVCLPKNLGDSAPPENSLEAMLAKLGDD